MLFSIYSIAAEDRAEAFLKNRDNFYCFCFKVCEGDAIIANVHNYLTGAEGTSIHWHGIYQHGSPHMDGVAMVTQCPIPAYSSFQYK